MPRPPRLSELLLNEEVGSAIDQRELARECDTAVKNVLDAQIVASIKIVTIGARP